MMSTKVVWIGRRASQDGTPKSRRRDMEGRIQKLLLATDLSRVFAASQFYSTRHELTFRHHLDLRRPPGCRDRCQNDVHSSSCDVPLVSPRVPPWHAHLRGCQCRAKISAGSPLSNFPILRFTLSSALIRSCAKGVVVSGSRGHGHSLLHRITPGFPSLDL